MPFWLGASIMFVYGAVVGSFINVIICRLPNDQSIVFPPSHCPKCKTKLRFWDLIPLFSFLLMGRKCRYCGEPVSWRYFWVELLTAVTFVGLYWHTSLPLTWRWQPLPCPAFAWGP
jgi:leader peptidase (prepilin peptidase) / N-methyltransferase